MTRKHWKKVVSLVLGGAVAVAVIGAVPASAATSSFTGWQAAYQSNAGDVAAYGGLAIDDVGQAAYPGSSPSVAILPNGGYEIASMSANGLLNLAGTARTGQLYYGLRGGSSPSIAASPADGTYVVAMQVNFGALWLWRSATNSAVMSSNMMANSTSPAVAAFPEGGYEVAYQGIDGNLALYGYDGGFSMSTGQAMKAGTSPSIAITNNVVAVAYQTPGGSVSVFTAYTGISMTTGTRPIGTMNSTMNMVNNTSPSIAGLTANGTTTTFKLAFRANTGNAYFTTCSVVLNSSGTFSYGLSGGTDTGCATKVNTGVGIAPLAGGAFQAVFQSPDGSLWSYPSTGAATSLGKAVSPSTPCVATALGGSCAPSSTNAAPLTLTSPASQSIQQGVPAWIILNAIGGEAPYAWSVTGLPAGMGIAMGVDKSTGAQLNGTPTTRGTFPVTVSVRANNGATNSVSFTLTVTA